MLIGECKIRANLESGAWSCNVPLSSLVIGANSVDVTLSNKFMTVECRDTICDIYSSRIHGKLIEAETMIIKPGAFILGCTNEAFNCGDCAPMYEGRSTIARLGIGSHVTAGFGDIGFSGCWTLELFNVGPLKVQLHAGMRIGQVYFMSVDGGGTYEGVYDGSKVPVPAMLGKR